MKVQIKVANIWSKVEIAFPLSFKTESGIYYNTLKEAAISLNMGYSSFKEKIKINKINFKYV